MHYSDLWQAIGSGRLDVSEQLSTTSLRVSILVERRQGTERSERQLLVLKADVSVGDVAGMIGIQEHAHDKWEVQVWPAPTHRADWRALEIVAGEQLEDFGVVSGSLLRLRERLKAPGTADS